MSLKLTSTQLYITQHILDRVAQRTKCKWDDLVRDLKGIKVPKKGSFKIYSGNKTYIVVDRKLVTCYASENGNLDRLIVKCREEGNNEVVRSKRT